MIFYGGEYATELCSEENRGRRMRREDFSVRPVFLDHHTHIYNDIPNCEGEKIPP